MVTYQQLISQLGLCLDAAKLDSPNLFLAFSGGLDSQVLLHVLIKYCYKSNSYKKKFKLTAIHIDHGLSKNAAKWSKECARVCAKYQVPIIIKKVNAKLLKSSGLSQEEVARNLRYQEFAKILPKGAVLFTAHHQDDQVETLLLQLMRGAGVKGLAAMPKVTKFAKGSLVRPFLDFSREQLQSYAKRHRLTWIEDESNLSAAFDRNFLRLHILPLLKNRWPGMLTTITRSAAHLAEANLLLDDLAARDLVKVRGKAPNTLSIAKLQALNLALQRNLIRYWLTKLALPLPSSKKLEQIIKCILPSKSDACPLVNWRGVEIRRFAGDIYAMLPLAKHDTNKRLKWDQKKPLKLPANLGILSAEPLNATAANNKHWPQRVTVGFRSGGEKITLLGHKHAKTLKNLFQEWRIPPWQRERIPLVYFENKLVAVVGYGVGELGRDWVFMLVED